jgi:hypothetical protein
LFFEHNFSTNAAMLRVGVAKAKAMDIRNFFGQPVSKARHVANSAMADVIDLERPRR